MRKVELHRHHFSEKAKDSEWLPEVASRGWVILSTDQFNYLEREAIRNAGGRAFLLASGNLTGEEQVAIVTGTLKRFLRILKTTSAPFIARIYRANRVIILSKELRPYSSLSK